MSLEEQTGGIKAEPRKKGVVIPIHIRKADQEGAIFKMMTHVGAELATMVVNDWRHDKRDVNISIVVALEDAAS